MAPSAEAIAAGRVAEGLINGALRRVKRKHRRNGVVVTVELISDGGIQEAYAEAVSCGDVAMMDAIRFQLAGLLSTYIGATGRVGGSMILAVLLSRRQEPDGALAGAVVQALGEAGVIDRDT